MQTSMGQTASTLNDLLTMYEEQTNTSPEVIETQLLQARKELIIAVKTAGDPKGPLDRLHKLKCPVSKKYDQLNVVQLLKENSESVRQLKTIVIALGVLEKYGRHLLKPPGSRVDQWRQIKFNNSIFKDRVLPMVGAVEVVQQLGYSEAADNGLQFAMEEPDPEATSILVADILLARTEMELYLRCEHSYPELFHAILPESTVNQVTVHWDMFSGEGTVNVNPPPSTLTSQQLNCPTPVSATEGETELVEPVQIMDPVPVSTNSGEMEQPTVYAQDDSFTKACDICGDQAATRWCRQGQCDNKQLCTDCDDMWHRHPKRLNHIRDPIASLPCPSNIQSQEPIMGPFGIRAVHSLSPQPRVEDRCPTVVSCNQSGGSPRSNARTPPPQQVEGSLPATVPPNQFQTQQGGDLRPTPLNPNTSIQVHQQQLQYYLQHQQRLQQQQQQVAPTPNLGYPAVSVHNAAYPSFPFYDPDNFTQQNKGHGALQVHPSVPFEQKTGNRFPPEFGMPASNVCALPGAVGGNSSVNASSVQQIRAENPKGIDPVSMVESGLVGSALERQQSGQIPHRMSLTAESSESFLLKTILAESNYEKRAAKCDIRLLTLEEELQQVEDQLNELMLNTADVTEHEDFLTLNRRKARLMKEHKALSNYRPELAGLLSAEQPRSDQMGNQHHSSQIFHAPPLSSAPLPFDSFPPPQASTVSSPIQQQQLGFSYPHQASQSPVNPQEPSPVYGYQAHPGASLHQGFYGNSQQLQGGIHSPNVQESVVNNTLANVNSSVDIGSILPQWQMVPTVTAVSSCGDTNQIPFYAPRYQQANVSNSYSPHSTIKPSFPTFATMNSESSSQLGYERQGISMGQGRPPTLTQDTRDSTERKLQNFRMPNHSASVNRNNHPSSRTAGLIGFEHMMEETHSTPKREVHRSSGIHVQKPAPKPQDQPAMAVAVTPQPPVIQPSSKFDVPCQNWECSHCTFINSSGTRVCVMCDRTSDNPILVGESEEMVESLVETSQASEPVSSLRSSSPYGAVASTLDASTSKEQNVYNEHLNKIHCRIAEEQDQVYLEKKEAHRQYNSSQMLQQQSQTEQQQESFSASSSSSSLHPNSSDPKPGATQNGPTSGSASCLSNEGALVVGLSKGAGESENCGDPRPSVQISQQVSGCEGSSSSGHSSSVQTRVAGSASLIQPESFSLAMEKFSEQKQIKQLQLDGAKYMHYIKAADRQGFQIEEMQAALQKCSGNYTEALAWLQSDWNKLVQVVVSSTRAAGQQLDQNDVGDLSEEEALTALRASKGDMVAAVSSCVASRKQLYASLNCDGAFAREEVLQAMLQGCGKEDLARHQLHMTVLQPFLEHVWKVREEEGAGADVNPTLLQMAMTDAACHSVSSSIIAHPDFQQTIMDQTVDRDRRVRMILVEGKLQSWGRADMVIKLLDVDLPESYPSVSAEEAAPYTLEDVVEAVRNCRDRRSARVYLTQECSTCFSLYPMSKIRNLNFCQCKICTDCLQQNFEVVIREKHVRHWTCPICGLPDLNDADIASEYLSFLGLLLQTQVDKDVYELFETKMRDWHLQKDPNFRWCAHCGNGFIANENQLRMVCPHCGDTTCYGCKRQWEDQHEGVTCAQFAQWKIDNDPNNQAVGLARHLEENGIDCPSCKMRYALAKGGCMHFKCPQCGHEFCSGCYQSFYQKGMCPSRLKSCKSSGLHAHHPRDCFFYLRDEDVDRLQSLLREANVPFNTTPPESQEDASCCPVIEQKEFDSGKQDESCGKETLDGHAGLCMTHYKEYLVGLINKNHIDPLMVMTVEEIKKLIKREEISSPKLSANEPEASYRKRLIKFVKEKIALPTRGP